MFEFRSKEERLYQKFPWLWAVLPHRTPLNEIKEVTLDGDQLYQNLGDPVISWWAHLRGDGYEDVFQINGTPDMRLAEGVIASIDHVVLSLSEVTHLVSRGKYDAIIIHRPPRKTSLKVMCLNRCSRAENACGVIIPADGSVDFSKLRVSTVSRSE